MIAANVLGFAVLASCLGSRWLPTARWTYRAPRLGIAAWYVLLATLVLSVLAVALSVVVPSALRPPVVCAVLLWCVHSVGGGIGTAVRVGGDIVSATVLLAGVTFVVRCGLRLRAQVRDRRAHNEVLTLVGRVDHALGGVTVLDHAQPAAYVSPGRSPRVVVTTAAIRQLTPTQLAAVLGHERAHAAGRHQILLDVVRVAAAAMPRARVFAAAQQQIARLIEIRADDVATRRHAPQDLAEALAAMVAGAPVAPAGVTAAHGGSAVERLHRLLDPPRPLHRAVAAGIVAAVAALPATPLAILVLCSSLPGLVRCVQLG